MIDQNQLGSYFGLSFVINIYKKLWVLTVALTTSDNNMVEASEIK